MLIDIHSHHKKRSDQIVLMAMEHCRGIHPWELLIPFHENEVFLRFEHLKSSLNADFVAVGECGLDRRRSGIVSIEEQKKVLIWHMYWALEKKLPLIIHCVRAHSDLLDLLHQLKYGGKILVHDFRGNFEQVEALLCFDVYFSFGKSLFEKNKKMAHLFMQMPKERIFLETDDQQEYSIEDIYQKAIYLLGIERDACEELFLANLNQFFFNVNNLSSSDIVNYLCRSSMG